MSDFEKLISECKTEKEKQAVYEIFRIIACLQKHERLRSCYNNNLNNLQII